MKGRGFFRLIFFSPALVGAVFVGVIFGVIFQKRTGLLNNILFHLIGFDLDFPWIQDPRFVMPAIILASLWMWVGFNMIYFLAALQNVDKQLEEAATIDGANAWQTVHPRHPAGHPPHRQFRCPAFDHRGLSTLRIALDAAGPGGRSRALRPDHRDEPLPDRVPDR